jgi:hypothetical protein
LRANAPTTHGSVWPRPNPHARTPSDWSAAHAPGSTTRTDHVVSTFPTPSRWPIAGAGRSKDRGSTSSGTDCPGKVRLIATGFGEAATGVNNADVVIDPAAHLFPGHSSETG